MAYKYRIECREGGKWVAKCSTDVEDIKQFQSIANATAHEYRIISDGKDITKIYKSKSRKE